MEYGIEYEYIQMKDTVLPVRIFEQQRMSDSIGAPLHWHEAIELYYIIEGGVEVLSNGEKQWLYPGDIAYIDWCEVHKGTGFLDNTTFLTVIIDVSSLEDEIMKDIGLGLIGNIQIPPVFIRGDEILSQLVMKLQEEYYKEDIPRIYMIRSILYHILAHVQRLEKVEKSLETQQVQDSYQLVKKMLFYISKNFTLKITLDSMSKEFGVTKSHLCRVFKTCTNQTIYQYISEYRCHTALNFIRNGMSLSDAAYQVGYNDYNYFSRVFKKVFGNTPRAFIKNTELGFNSPS